MSKKRRKKGEFGYPAYERKVVILRTAVYFLMSLAVFLLGYLSTGHKENLLTIVAVLGLLPSSKSLVSVIMYVRIPRFSEAVYQAIAERAGEVPVLYSMYLTSYKLDFPIDCFAMRGNDLIGYTASRDCKAADCEAHIQGILKQNGIKNVTIKIFYDQARFIGRLEQLQGLEPAEHKEAEVLALLCDISL